MKGILILSGLLALSQVTLSQTVLAESDFDAENISEIYIDGKFCDVTITSGNKVSFSGIIEGRGDPGDYEFKSDVKGSNLEIEVVKYVSRGWNQIRRAKMEIQVPSSTKIEIDNSSGDVYINGIESQFIIDVSSGDVDLVNLQGDLEVGSSSGDVSIKGFDGVLELETTSGDQLLQDLTGEFDVESTSGDIEMYRVTGPVSIRSTSGDIEVREVKAGLVVRTTSGNIDGYNVDVTSNSTFRANSGEIDIDFKNDISDLSFDLQSSSGNLEAGSREGERELFVKRGEILITGVTTSGDQEYH